MTSYAKKRETKETKLTVEIDDEKDFKTSEIDTGIGFFDHMLTLFSFHSELYVNIQAEGDLYVDGHHTVEDIGIVLGQLIQELYSEKESYVRYGAMYLPMDESLARVVLDLSGRPHLSFNAEISKEKVGDFDTELTEEFFNAVAMNARMTLHVDLLKTGNSHHEIEAVFKGFARSLKIALQPSDSGVPSSKGVIE
ncbi:Imidazoleglycerol-phosphate dehydratase [Jeotgalicoccus aerolatus]|jgi:imidazoleglycerol-phosphate dehydratase|uniref:Imidazoleglycerol-phosphate dehydratase n=1 Tax=Jeotgalicoccus aerolatus TaxID=709510 RepID=A0A1G8XG57_9STAP|nr:imidazoleglycerol-phosphate dehydratase HisB [Jeotgalicoccus aerolatus]MBP1952338.1 imidazoleglycerol-phosphate dehydratase [Jeotgalicoccus aerolatus]CAD2072783.1 Imidazoleglycerol-phosphate dehydratase [Jeotgalicoccus aerolatus]SDJ88740.1 imidazoleglycerol-phosphate dehydratase [Jeotgalicoccus aerolatus]GGE03510.1 imidazoleglycerol-phosphate dehydratase [Jeotgalicoccus aerolatus]HJG33725.1 imidazoleglycerol-phosphate dehydratase HisB [Jeotgalicoccus aerolatus]